MNSNHVSIIVPCYNEEAVIEVTYHRLVDVMKGWIKQEKNKGHRSYEIVIINDGSTDTTLSILKKLAKHDKKLKVLSFSRNFGHQPAVTAGICNCTGDMAVIIDADLQDPPELIPDMIKKMEEEVLPEEGIEVIPSPESGDTPEEKNEN